MPAAYAPITRAVAGATTTRSAALAEAVCGIGSVLAEQLDAGRLGRERREGRRTDEAGRVRGEDRRDVRAGVDEAAADLDRLVGGDPAADAEDDGSARHSDPIADSPCQRLRSSPASASLTTAASAASRPGSAGLSVVGGVARVLGLRLGLLEDLLVHRPAPRTLPAAISSRAIESGLRATEVTCGGTMAPRPSPSWLKYELIWRPRLAARVTRVNFESTLSSRTSIGGSIIVLRGSAMNLLPRGLPPSSRPRSRP